LGALISNVSDDGSSEDARRVTVALIDTRIFVAHPGSSTVGMSGSKAPGRRRIRSR
jgi:hypothetical protein